MSITRLSLCIDHSKKKYWVVVENKSKPCPLYIGFCYTTQTRDYHVDGENSGWARALRYKTFDMNQRNFHCQSNDSNFPNWRDCVVDFEEFEEYDL